MTTIHSSFQLRPLVLIIAMVMAAMGGYINVSLLEFFHIPVSHMSGAVSRLSVDIGSNNAVDFKIIIMIVSAFIGGATFSGAFLGNAKLRPGRRYGILMIFEGLLLAWGAYWVGQGNRVALLLVAMACGIQNGMFSSYHSLVIRTTHVTGIVTDLGLLVGHWLRYSKVDGWKIIFLSSLLGGFFCGGLLAALANNILGVKSLWLAAVACLIFGASYWIWRKCIADPK